METHALQAVRALRRAYHANRAWLQDAAEWAEADAAFDCGELGGGRAVEMEIDQRIGALREAVANRFDLHPMELELAEMAHSYHEVGCMMTGKRAQRMDV